MPVENNTFGGEVSDETKEATDKDLERGLIAVNQLMVCEPYAAGNSFTLADMYTFYSFGLINMISEKMFSKDPLANYPKIKTLLEMLASHPSIQRVETEKSQ